MRSLRMTVYPLSSRLQTTLHLMRKFLSGLTILFAALPIAAQQSRPFDFSIRNIMRGPSCPSW